MNGSESKFKRFLNTEKKMSIPVNFPGGKIFPGAPRAAGHNVNGHDKIDINGHEKPAKPVI